MKRNITIILFALLASIIFFGWLSKHILLLSPFSTHKVKTRKIHKKVIKVFYYQQKEKQELVSVFWPQTMQEQLYTMVTGWLILLKKEQIIPRDIFLGTVLVDTQNLTAYLSFSCHFLQAFEPTSQKLDLLESLFKTISQNNELITKIILLVDHHPMQDDFLDFSQAWPIT